MENARESWKALDKLGEKNELFLFKTGMLHLSNDEFEECIKYLEKGLQLNHTNPALNKDMERMINKAKEALNQNSTTDASKESDNQKEDTKSAGNKLLLSAYEKRDDDDVH